MADLFGDDSSSDDDDNNNNDNINNTTTNKEDTALMDSSDDDDDVKLTERSKGKKKLLARAELTEEQEQEQETQLSTHNPLLQKYHTNVQKLDGEEEEEEALEDLKLQPRKVEMLDVERPLEKIPDPYFSVHSTKLPNILGIQTEAFEKDTYNPVKEEKDFHGYTHNLIRWRYKRDENGQLMRDEENKLVRESNARFIKYSDGSIQLQIGEERFEIDSHTSGHSFVFLTQKATLTMASEDGNNGDGSTSMNKRAVTLLESQGPAISSKLLARPSSLQSAAHRTMTLALRQKTMKSSRIVEVSTTHDPEMIKQQKIKMKNDLMKDERRRSGADRASIASSRRRPGMNRNYLDDDYDDDDRYESTNITSMKKNIKQGSAGVDMYDEEDDDEEDEADRWQQRKTSRSKASAKRSRVESAVVDDSDSSSADGDVAFGDDDSSDDEEVALASRKKIAKTAHQIESDSE